MRCKTCSYPIFAYTRCCPNCSEAVESPEKLKQLHLPQSRIGLWLVRFRRVIAVHPVLWVSLVVSNLRH